MQLNTPHLAMMVLTFLIAAVTSSCLARQPNVVAQSEILELTGKFHEALVKKDIEALNRMTSDDFTWIMVDDIHVDKSKWLIKVGGEDSPKVKAIDIENIKTTTDESKATLFGRIISIVTFSTERHLLEHKFVYSFIYRFEIRQGHWEIINAGFDYSK